MRVNTILAAVTALSTAVVANTVTFVPMDDKTRTVIFTPTVPHAKIDDIEVKGGQSAVVEFPQEWLGNWYAIDEGADPDPGMLGEVAFQGHEGRTYFDVSAIIDPEDHGGVKMMYPKEAETPTSGCEEFPCDNAYYLWDDEQTKVTDEVHLICTLGG